MDIIAPGALPSLLLQYRPELEGGQVPDFIVHLPDNPWVKLKPNSKVTSVGYRGDDFTRSWETDSLGFKNLSGLAARSHVTAVAVGDSFVEGMGARTEDVWTTILTQRGFTVYNLGIQGYAPQQMVGVLKLYGERFHPDVILIGYTPGFEARALVYESGSPAKNYAGGVQSMNSYIEERRRMATHFKITNAFFSLLSDSYGIVSSQSGDRSLRQYTPEVEHALGKTFDPQSRAWSLTKVSILELKREALRIGARPIVLIFAHRPLVYYEKVMGTPPPHEHYEIQLIEAVKLFCRENGILTLETLDELKAYVATLPEKSSDELPYWRIDGHLSRSGNRIVAEVVEKYFRTAMPLRPELQPS